MNFAQSIPRLASASLIVALVCSAVAVAQAQDECQPVYVYSASAAQASNVTAGPYVESMSIDEPYPTGGVATLVFRIKVEGLEQLADKTPWKISFRFADDPAQLPRFVAMIMEGGRARFTFTGIQGEQSAERESGYTPDGMLTIVIRKDQLRPDLAPGHQLIDITFPGSREARTEVDPAQQDAGSGASYTINGTCQLETPPLRLANISGRSLVRQNENVGIGGFIVAGPGGKRVIVRGTGTSLKADNSPLPGRLADPTIELRTGSGELIAENDNWRESPQAREIRESGLAPAEDEEAAVVAPLEAGPYTAVVRGAGGTQGIGVIEIYDLQVGSSSELANLAARAFVATGDNLLVGGFILNGAPAGGILLRAIGPSLAGRVPNELQDPTMELFDPQGLKIAENDDWRKARNEAQIEATGAAPTHEKEAAILMGLSAGNYTAVVRGVGNGTGNGVVEIYRLQESAERGPISAWSRD